MPNHQSADQSSNLLSVTRASTSRVVSIFSVGYEGRSIEDFVDTMVRHSIQVVVDVRLNPISRKKGFSKKALSKALNAENIEYRHERALGNPPENRSPFRNGYQSARDSYKSHLENGASEAFSSLVESAFANQVALLCLERDHLSCHRSCITEMLQEENPNFVVMRI